MPNQCWLEPASKCATRRPPNDLRGAWTMVKSIVKIQCASHGMVQREASTTLSWIRAEGSVGANDLGMESSACLMPWLWSSCWGMTNLVISLMLTRMIQRLVSGWGSNDQMTGAMGHYGLHRDLDLGPLVTAKLARSTAKLACPNGLWSPCRDLNPGSWFGWEWCLHRYLDPGPLVNAKLAGSAAKLAGSKGLWSLHQDLNPSPWFEQEWAGLVSERGEYRVDPTGTWRKGIQALSTQVTIINTRVQRSVDSKSLEITGDAATGIASHTVYVGM